MQQPSGNYLPDTSQLAHFNVPSHCDALGSDDVEPLGIGADLAGIQRLAHRCGQLCLVYLALQCNLQPLWNLQLKLLSRQKYAKLVTSALYMQRGCKFFGEALQMP